MYLCSISCHSTTGGHRNHPALQAAYTAGVRDAERQFRSLEQQREEQRTVAALDDEKSLQDTLAAAVKDIKVLNFEVPQGAMACSAESQATAQCLKAGKGLECATFVSQLEDCARQAIASTSHG